MLWVYRNFGRQYDMGKIMTDYNYDVFDLARETPIIEEFPSHNLKVGMRAVDALLEDLNTQEIVRLRDLCRDGLLIIEFGSYT